MHSGVCKWQINPRLKGGREEGREAPLKGNNFASATGALRIHAYPLLTCLRNFHCWPNARARVDPKASSMHATLSSEREQRSVRIHPSDTALAKSIVASLSHPRGRPSPFLVPPPAKVVPCLIIMGRVRPFVVLNRGGREAKKKRKEGGKTDAKSPLSVTTKRTLSIFSPPPPRGACAHARW